MFAEICKQAPVAGLCSESVTQYYYDWLKGECMTFQYTGCRGNANRFAGRSDCEAVCKGVGKSQLQTTQHRQGWYSFYFDLLNNLLTYLLNYFL